MIFQSHTPASDELIGTYPALLRNALDWANRPSESDPTGLVVFAGKVAAVVSASLGVLGGTRARNAFQISLHKPALPVIPNSFALGLSHQTFDEHRRLRDGDVERNVRGVGAALIRTAIALAQRRSAASAETGEGRARGRWLASQLCQHTRTFAPRNRNGEAAGAGVRRRK